MTLPDTPADGSADIQNTTSSQKSRPPETMRMVDLEPVMQALGSGGRYQIQQLMLQIFAGFLNAIPTMAVVFIGFQPDYQCKEVDNSTHLLPRISQNDENTTITDTVYNECSIDVTLNVSAGLTTESLSCVDGVNFSMPSDTSFLTEWSLVCDKAGLTELSQTVIFAGQALGSALTSSLADRYGRRKLYIVCLLGVAAGMFSISFVDNYPLSLFCRVVTGFCQTGMVNAAYTMLMELLPHRWRFTASVVDSVMWSSSCILMATAAYFMQGMSWRYLNLAYASVFAYSLILPWFLDESLRWLIATGNIQEVKRILKKACLMNGKDFRDIEKVLLSNIAMQNCPAPEENVERPNARHTVGEESKMMSKPNGTSDSARSWINRGYVPDDESMGDNGAGVSEAVTGDNSYSLMKTDSCPEKETNSCATAHTSQMAEDRNTNTIPEEEIKKEEDEEEKSPSAKYTLLDLVKHRVVFVPFLVVASVWITNNLYYYGVMLGSSNLSGNRFLNFALLSFLDIPSTVLALFLMPRFNRKTLALFYGFPTSLFLLLSVLLVQLGGAGAYITLATVAEYVSKFTVTGSYVVLFIYYMEVFPTAMRAAATGMASALVKAFNMVTPFFVMWSEYNPWAPGVLISSLVFLATLSVLLIPETRLIKLPDTIEEIKAWKKKSPAVMLEIIEKPESRIRGTGTAQGTTGKL